MVIIGVYVDLYKVDFNDYVEQLMEEPKINDKEMLEKIMLEFGEKVGDYFILLNNEHYSDYNSYYSMFRLIDKYFGIVEFEDQESHEVFLNLREEMISNRNEYDVADELELNVNWDDDY